jgi:hypothetical protein
MSTAAAQLLLLHTCFKLSTSLVKARLQSLHIL